MPDARKILVIWLFVYEIRFGVCGFGVQHYVETQQKKDTIDNCSGKRGNEVRFSLETAPLPNSQKVFHYQQLPQGHMVVMETGEAAASVL